MRIWISGASGLIGGALFKALSNEGHELLRISHRESKSAKSIDELIQSPPEGAPDLLINLSGRSIAKAAWTDEEKKRLIESRTGTVEKLSRVLKHYPNGATNVIQVSACGYYGDAVLEKKEAAAQGEGFLAEMAARWEASAEAAFADQKLFVLRLGMVVSPDAPAWKKLCLPYRLHSGAIPAKSPSTWVALTAMQNLVQSVRQIAYKEMSPGVYNLVSETLSWKDLDRALKKHFGFQLGLRPPAWTLAALLGAERAEALIHHSQNINNDKLKNHLRLTSVKEMLSQ